MQLSTDWITIGTSGPTVDGRKISEQMLKEAAESYDPEEYQAVISSDHLLWWYGNFGEVVKIKNGTDKKGRTTLQAKIHPNQRLIEMNRQGQRLHTSMELTDDFAGTGKAYLMGLAVTDEPASLGTSQLQFSSKGKPCPIFIGQPEEVDYSTGSTEQTGQPTEPDDDTFFKRFFQRFSSELKNQHDPNEDDDMTSEQFNTLKDLAEKQLEAVKTMTEKMVETFSKPQTTAAVGQPPNTTESTPPAATQITEELTSLKTQLEELNSKLEKGLEGKPATQVPTGSGAGQEAAFL